MPLNGVRRLKMNLKKRGSKVRRGIMKVATIPARIKLGNKRTNKAMKKLGY